MGCCPASLGNKSRDTFKSATISMSRGARRRSIQEIQVQDREATKSLSQAPFVTSSRERVTEQLWSRFHFERLLTFQDSPSCRSMGVGRSLFMRVDKGELANQVA